MTPQTYTDIISFLRMLIKGTPWEGNLYSVGGCCRDMALGCDINDIDLAVTLPDGGVAFAEWLHAGGYTAAEPTYFRKYGTARLTLREYPDEEIEIVQTRSEKYTDRTSRNPAIAFGSIEDDCYRRDLTINSLYQNVTTGEVLDITGRGLSDLRDHIIRTPAKPDVTFDDDPLRILRAIRFACRYGWELDSDTVEAMTRHVDRLSIISPERLYGEFEKIMLCQAPGWALDMLRRTGAMKYIIPELCPTFRLRQSSYHFGTVWEHTLRTVDNIAPATDLRLAALLHDIGKVATRKEMPDGEVRFPRHDRSCRGTIAKILNRFRCRTPFIDRVIFLCVNHEAAKSWGPEAEKMTDTALRRLEMKCASAARFDKLLQLIDADNRAYAPDHCMPGQVPAIRIRAEELRIKDGRMMFGYHIPLKISRLSKILHTRDSKVLGEWIDKLTLMGLDNPSLTREDMAAIVHRAAGTQAESAQPKKHRKKKKRSNARPA